MFWPNKDKNLEESFESLSQFINYLEAMPEEWPKKDSSSLGKKSDDWNGNVTFSQALELSRSGWSEGLEDLDTEVKELEHELGFAEQRTRFEASIYGQVPIVPNYLAGVPTDMFRFYTEQEQKPVLKIVCNNGMLADVDGETYIRRGAAICALIDTLESQGIRTEVSVYHYSKSDSSTSAYCEIKIKEPQDPLDLDMFGFVMCNPAMHRRLVFRFRERSQLYESYVWSYGRTFSKDDIKTQTGTLHIRNADSGLYGDNGKTSQDFFNEFSKQYEAMNK